MTNSLMSGDVVDLYVRSSSCGQSIVSLPCPSFTHAVGRKLAQCSDVNGLIDCRPVARGWKRVDLVAGRGERESVRSLFGCDTRELLHCLRIEYVDDAGVANGDVEASVHA